MTDNDHNTKVENAIESLRQQRAILAEMMGFWSREVESANEELAGAAVNNLERLAMLPNVIKRAIEVLQASADLDDDDLIVSRPDKSEEED